MAIDPPKILDINTDRHWIANETYDLTFERNHVDSFGFDKFVWQGTQTIADFAIIGQIDAIIGRETNVWVSI